MANFMGPMAPPQAATPQPAQLDIRTSPNQRAQFKSFMQGMQVQPTTAPIAPMLPAPMPSPMDQVDIFAPAPMADGGVVGGLNKLGEMSGQMVEALDAVVYGGGQGGGMSSGGGGILGGPMGIRGGPMSSGGGFGGGNMPAPLPPMSVTFPPPSPYQTTTPTGTPLSLNDSALLGMPTPSYMPMDPDGDGMDQQGRPMESGLSDEQRAQAERDQQDRITSLRSTLNNQGSAFGSGGMGNPLARLSGLGNFGSVFGYEDGGPVRMRRGGVTFESGRTYETGRGIGEQNREMDALERAQAVDDIQDAISAASTGRQADADRYQAMADYFLDDEGNIPALSADAQSYIKETGTPAVNPFSVMSEDMVGSPDAFVPPAGDTGSTGAAFNPRDEVADTGLLGAIDPGNVNVDSPLLDAIDPGNVTYPLLDKVVESSVDPISAPNLDYGFGYTPFLDLNADVTAISPMEQFALDQGAAQKQRQDDSLAALLSDPMNEFGGTGSDIAGASTPEGRMAALAGGQINTGNENLDNRTRLRDLEIRSQGSGAPGIAGMLAKGLGGGLSSKIVSNVFDKGRTAVLNENNQIVGYIGDGLIPGTEAYTGRPGYDPFGSNAGVTFDSETGAYRVTANAPGFDSPDSQYDSRAAQEAVTPPPADIIDPVVPPLTPNPPPPVVVPSPRGPVDITAPVLTGAAGVDPLTPVGLPQSFLDLLASFNRPAPRAMQDGGAVLDQAAGNFLEALKVA